MTGNPILTLESVHSGYGPLEVLRGITIEVREGEIVTLLGANGAGKSTTLNTICGIVRTREGTIHLYNEDISHAPVHGIVGKGLSQVPEGRQLFGDMSVLENLEMGAYLRSDRDGIREDLEHCFELFPILAERKKQMAGSLSGGEQQMCAIARALMARPKILLLDEPSLGLAPILVQQIFDIIRRLNDEGTTIFLVEQNANAALRLAHRGYVMETGTITHCDTAEVLLSDKSVQDGYLGY